MNDNVILLGELSTIEDIMNTFLGIEKYIIDCYSYQTDYDIVYDNYSIKSLNNNIHFEQNIPIVLSVGSNYDGCKEYICTTYGINEDNIVLARNWLLEKIKNKQLIIRPPFVRMELSTICQLNCRECYMRKNNFGAVGRGYLSFENFKNFIEKNKYIKRIEVSNSGEVFLNPDIEDILKYAYENGITITMNNGVNLNSVSANILEAIVKYQVYSMTISIDGATPEVYAYYRRNGNLEKVLENIKYINEFKKKYNSEYPIMKWQFVVMNHNIGDVELAKKMAYENDMTIFFKKDWSSNYDIDKVDMVSELVGFDVTSTEIDYSGCWDLIFCPQINWDGRLLGCSFLYWDDWKVNVFENDFIDTINNNDNYKGAIYKILGDKTDLNLKLPCDKCIMRVISI